jgi:hypothetical protein
MGFKVSWDVGAIEHQLRRLTTEINSPYNDGFTASTCKRELYRLKCLIEDLYNSTPKFVDEETWERDRVYEILKK